MSDTEHTDTHRYINSTPTMEIHDTSDAAMSHIDSNTTPTTPTDVSQIQI